MLVNYNNGSGHQLCEPPFSYYVDVLIPLIKYIYQLGSISNDHGSVIARMCWP